MMGILKPVLPILFMIGTVTGCGDVKYADGNGGSDPNGNTNDQVIDATNTIDIISVIPNSAQVGTPTNFTVEVQYKLSSSAQGVLDIGFNTATFDSYDLLPAAQHIVGKGMGTYTFDVTGITPVDWSPENFKAAVFLSEYPTPSPWQPYASNIAPIPLTAAAAKASTEISKTSATVPSSATCYKAAGIDDFCVKYQ